MSPSKRMRTWLIHILELIIICLKLFSNADCLDWTVIHIQYSMAAVFSASRVATPRGSVPSTVHKCAVPINHLCSEISFLRPSNSPDLI